MTGQELINDVPKLLAYIICIACLIQLFVIFYMNKGNIIKDLRGPDERWQFLELTGIAWLVIFPCVVICSLLGLEISGGAWASLDAIYFMNIGGKMGHKWLDNKNGNKSKEKDETVENI